MRKLGQAKRNRQLQRAFERIHAEAQGVFKLQIIPCDDVPGLIGSAMVGDEAAAAMLGLMADAIAQIRNPRSDALCLLCEYEFSAQRPPYTFVLFNAMRDDRKQAVANGLCRSCAHTPDLQDRVIAQYKRLFRDFRVIHPHPAPERADH